MEKSNLIKIVAFLIIAIMTMVFATTVYAEDLDDLTDDFGDSLLDDDDKNKTPGNNTPANNTPANNTPANNTPANNTPANNTPVNNSSIYNDENLPKTGIEDSIPFAVLVVVAGISAVYAYNKIRDYRNI